MKDDIIILNKNLSDINPLLCGQEECEAGHTYRAIRDYYLFHYILKGSGEFVKHDKVYSLTADHLFLIRPGELTEYRASTSAPWHYAWIGFQSKRSWNDLLRNDVLYAPNLRHLFEEMLSAKDVEGIREYYICGKIYELFCMLGKEEDARPKGPASYIVQAKSYIKANYMHEISVSHLAEILNLERSYFSTLFKKHTGKSPQQYIVDFRLKKAAELIALHSYTIERAALACGYTDACNFSKMFKRKYRISPARYAKTKFYEDNPY